MTELLSLMFLTPYTYLDLNKSAFFLKKIPRFGATRTWTILWCECKFRASNACEVWKLTSNTSTSTDLHHCEWVSSFLFHPPNMFVIPAVMFISHYNVILLCHHIFVISLMLFRGSVVEMVVSELNLIFK